jgi:phosphomannomutase/phosphoglucomutase
VQGARKLFGTAGVRGITNIDITPELVLKLASAYAMYLKKIQGSKRLKLAVGHDTRYGAQMLAQAAAAGIQSAGADVVLYRNITTGGISVNMLHANLNGGVLITGSHMGPDRIAFIALLADGAYAPVEVTDQIENLYANLPGRIELAKANQVGQMVQDLTHHKVYIKEILSRIDVKGIASKGFKILVDPANGAAGPVIKRFFRALGCWLKVINGTARPIPARLAEPRAQTVGKATKAVTRYNCDLGICLDTDADRVLFIDEQGIPISEDTVGALFVDKLLNKDDVCVTPINSSGLIEQVCRQKGVKLEYCRIGQPPTVQAIKRFGARFAYEESGKYYFCTHYRFADGIFAGGKLLQILASTGLKLSQLVQRLPKFYQIKSVIDVTEDQKEELMEKIEGLWQTNLLEERERDLTLDGLKRIYKDCSWLLIRKSGTEPLIRVYSDAPSLDRARELVTRGRELVLKAAKL